MKKNLIILSIGMFALIIASCNSSKHDAKEILLQKVDSVLSIAAKQSILMAESLIDKG